jgi:hypothetical protein
MEVPTARAGETGKDDVVSSGEAPALIGWQPNKANNQDKEPQPHKTLAPSSQEANECSIISVPTAPIEMSEERVRCLAFFGIFSI